MHDVCVVGGGIVGLATGMRLLEERPGARVVIVEKEASVGQHQTGHNSGVIHAGVYYAPGSLKAKLCREGANATKAFAADHGVPFEVCGKLLVATDAAELARMSDLEKRCRLNGIAVSRLSAEELGEREPAITGVGALHVASSGIVDYRQICEAMARVVRSMGGEIRLSTRVTDIRERHDAVEIDTAGGVIECRQLVACAGLQSDRLARMAGLDIDFSIVPFRGEYFRLADRHAKTVSHLIYPIPDPALPFLGIHLTRMIDGSVTLGPNAVLGLSREGYRKLSVDPRDISRMVGFPGFWRVMLQNLTSGIREIRNSLWKSQYLKACQKYCPTLEIDDLEPFPAGIRAQAVKSDGSLVQDFLFANSERMLHVCNAPSPAATSAIPIATMIVERLLSSPRDGRGPLTSASARAEGPPREA